MKNQFNKLFVLSFIFLMCGFGINAQTTNNQPKSEQEIFRELGLVSQLVELKLRSESYLANDINDKTVKIKYSKILLKNTRIILQLMVDLREKNSPRLFKKLNTYYKTHALGDDPANANKDIKLYCEAFRLLYTEFSTIPTNSTKGGNAGVGIADFDLVAAGTLLETFWKDWQDVQSKKVDGIIDVLSKLLLDTQAASDKK